MEEDIIHHKIISGLLGILLCSALIGVIAAEDCGCGGFDVSPPDFGSFDPGFSGPDSHDNSNGGPSSGSGDVGPSDSGSSSSGSSSAGSGSQTSGSSMSSDSGSGSMNSGGGSADDAVLLTVKGLDLFRKGDFNNSLIALNASLVLDPYTPMTWMVKGDVLASLGRFDEAISAYNKVISLDPSDPTAYAKKGDALTGEGKFNEAVASYDHALASNPGLSAVQANRTLAVDLASGLTKGNLTATSSSVVTVVPASLPEAAVSTGNTPVAISDTSPVSSTKAPLSIFLLLGVIPITGLLLFISNRKK